jgi:preprotein translocase subunit YajC
VPLVGLSVKLLETRLGSLCTFIVLVFMFYNNIYKYKRQKERNRKKKKEMEE